MALGMDGLSKEPDSVSFYFLKNPDAAKRSPISW